MMELTTNIMVIISLLYGGNGALNVKQDESLAQPPVKQIVADGKTDTTIVDGMALAAPFRRTTNLETDVREYFKDTPILAEIAKCESQFKHVGLNGKIITGKVNKGDLGVMQINKYYHAEDAEKLGLDLNTLEGNMAFAKHLYDKYGTDPWLSSSACWQKYASIAKK
jgi:hypothetical protein